MKPTKKKNMWAILSTPMIPKFVDPLLAAIAGCNNFLYDFTSLFVLAHCFSKIIAWF